MWRCRGQQLPITVPSKHIERGKQRRGPVPDVVVGLPGGNPRSQRQNRLGSIQGLNLALFIDAQDQGLVRWMQIQPHHVPQFVHEIGIPAQLEGLGSMGLQAVGPPDAPHRGFAHALGPGQSAAAPVRGLPRRGVQRGVHDGLHLSSSDALATPGPRSVAQQSHDAGLRVALTPQQNRRAGDAQLLGQTIIGNPLRRSQNDPGAKSNFLRCVATAHESFDDFSIPGGQK